MPEDGYEGNGNRPGTNSDGFEGGWGGTSAAYETDWWTWTSPNRVDHLVPGDRPCATCGRHHPRPSD